MGCVFLMVDITILPHVVFERNDHRKDAPDFICVIYWGNSSIIYFSNKPLNPWLDKYVGVASYVVEIRVFQNVAAFRMGQYRVNDHP